MKMRHLALTVFGIRVCCPLLCHSAGVRLGDLFSFIAINVFLFCLLFLIPGSQYTIDVRSSLFLYSMSSILCVQFCFCTPCWMVVASAAVELSYTHVGPCSEEVCCQGGPCMSRPLDALCTGFVSEGG